MTGSARLWRGIALGGYFALLVLLTLWYTLLAPSRIFAMPLVLAVMLIPLLLPIRGLLQGRVYTYSWTLFISLAYFTHGVVEWAGHPGERLYGALETLFSLSLFIGALLFVRLSKRAQS
jgi:uncharacterized membrane protein